MTAEFVFRAKGLTKVYRNGALEVHALRGIDFQARKGEFDGVLTMYHDQGQIAMKLIGFEEGVTLLGGFPFPLVTPAHGSAYDIAGRGIAHPGATLNAMAIGARMAAARRKG